ncbi:glucuronate isomerase [Alteromonas stellipolaris]|uniref:glucuronate isomerase n=1 Tax=Alteromonas stellipolaris TaxID=233316 RepID=UPI0026E39BE8|nr:glucuronate isomerase [Alteromonas stellipolaris]MDO6534525.1 glucuronate isomerase [Alteromonas stellipolaris]MDO6626402.1 glucuronate isomerase [Alteromonas stellipolaris]
MESILLHEDRLFPSDSATKKVARTLYQEIRDLPIISPHGHTDPRWFAQNKNFTNATELFITPDHYVFRMLYSQGISLESLGVPRWDGGATESDPRKIWQILADNYYLFAATPSRMWLDTVFHDVFGLTDMLCSNNATEYYEHITTKLQDASFKPRALMDRFNIELIATTEGALDELSYHGALKGTGWDKRVITTFRPDDVVDASREDIVANIEKLGALTNEDTQTWQGYLNAIRARRTVFRAHGATATDHGHPTANTADLSTNECITLFDKVRTGQSNAEEQELFRAQMLTELAGMSVEDGMVMQIHPGSFRNHNTSLFNQFGRDKGHDIPMQTDFVRALRPLLSKYGNEPSLNIILFTLDETTYSRELAPLAGHYPCLKLGPAWWFHDSPEGMLRFRHQVTETAGFFNTVGFNDDTRAFLSIPARHDVARRIDCRFLAELVVQHRISETEAASIAKKVTYDFAKQAYKLG